MIIYKKIKTKYYTVISIFGITFPVRIDLHSLLTDIDNTTKKTASIIKIANDIFYNAQIYTHLDNEYANTFLKFKQVNRGEDIYIIASGPSAINFSSKSCGKYIAINGAARLLNYKFDYIFLTDLLKQNVETNDFIDVRRDVTKFYAVLPQRRASQVEKADNSGKIPQNRMIESGAIPFYLEDVFANKWATDLAHEPFGDFGGSVFSALQFALYTYPRRIFLVGCDCTNGYAYKTSYVGDNSGKIRFFKMFKIFAESEYPNIEIISVNPVGLKGLFHDVYTESFLNDHSEIDRKTVEILQQGE